jgi:hypothetical protein
MVHKSLRYSRLAAPKLLVTTYFSLAVAALPEATGVGTKKAGQMPGSVLSSCPA